MSALNPHFLTDDCSAMCRYDPGDVAPLHGAGWDHGDTVDHRLQPAHQAAPDRGPGRTAGRSQGTQGT